MGAERKTMRRKDKSAIAISATEYSTADSSCAVLWIVETAGARGPSYAVHARCTDASQPHAASATDLIIRPQGNDRISVGKSFDEMRPYERCPAR